MKIFPYFEYKYNLYPVNVQVFYVGYFTALSFACRHQPRETGACKFEWLRVCEHMVKPAQKIICFYRSSRFAWTEIFFPESKYPWRKRRFNFKTSYVPVFRVIVGTCDVGCENKISLCWLNEYLVSSWLLLPGGEQRALSCRFHSTGWHFFCSLSLAPSLQTDRPHCSAFTAF